MEICFAIQGHSPIVYLVDSYVALRIRKLISNSTCATNDLEL